MAKRSSVDAVASKMTLPLLQTALSKLDHGGWSLTVDGFARRALHIRGPLTAREHARLRDLMHATGLKHRRVKADDGFIDVWDIDVA